MSGLGRRRWRRREAAFNESVTGLLEKRFPGLGQQIEVVDVATPITTLRITGNGHG